MIRNPVRALIRYFSEIYNDKTSSDLNSLFLTRPDRIDLLKKGKVVNCDQNLHESSVNMISRFIVYVNNVFLE